jgi:sec-independent protein translocase protein TatB
MFEIGFAELFLLGVIALLVVGPDRLPGLARTVGVWVGKAQRLVGQVRADIEREVRADELRKAAKEYSPTAVISDMRKEVEDFASDTSGPVDLDAEKPESTKPESGDGESTGPTATPATESEAADPKAADTAGADEPASTEPAAGDASEPVTPAGSSQDVTGTVHADETQTTAAHAPEQTESRLAEPPAADTDEPEDGKLEDGGKPENGESASAADSGPEAAKPAEGTERSNGRAENVAPPTVMESVGAPQVERDERTAAP